MRSMNLENKGETLSITGLQELRADNCDIFRRRIKDALNDGQRIIEIDLSQTRFVDSSGLGALISLYKTTGQRNGLVRLLNPTPRVRKIFEITRTHRIFEIVHQNRC